MLSSSPTSSPMTSICSGSSDKLIPLMRSTMLFSLSQPLPANPFDLPNNTSSTTSRFLPSFVRWRRLVAYRSTTTRTMPKATAATFAGLKRWSCRLIDPILVASTKTHIQHTPWYRRKADLRAFRFGMMGKTARLCLVKRMMGEIKLGLGTRDSLGTGGCTGKT